MAHGKARADGRVRALGAWGKQPGAACVGERRPPPQRDVALSGASEGAVGAEADCAPQQAALLCARVPQRASLCAGAECSADQGAAAGDDSCAARTATSAASTRTRTRTRCCGEGQIAARLVFLCLLVLLPRSCGGDVSCSPCFKAKWRRCFKGVCTSKTVCSCIDSACQDCPISNGIVVDCSCGAR